MIFYIYNIGVDLYNGFNGLRHRINWTYFTVLNGLAHPLYSYKENALKCGENYKKTMHMSKARIYDQLTSEYGEKFTTEQAQYAIDNLDE